MVTARKLGLGSGPLPDGNGRTLAAASSVIAPHVIAPQVIAPHPIASPGLAWVVLTSLFLIGSFIVLGSGTPFLPVLDYAVQLSRVAGVPAFALCATARVLRLGKGRSADDLLGSWLFAWLIIGVGAAWMFSSAGPCFYNELVGTNQSFAELNARLTLLAAEAAAQGREISAIPFQTTLIDVHKLGRFGPAGGISAMPSMHVAMATLFAIGGFTIGRSLGAVMTLYAVFVWIGSVHLGWHYASDGPVAAVLMLLIWKASGRTATRFIAQAEPLSRAGR